MSERSTEVRRRIEATYPQMAGTPECEWFITEQEALEAFAVIVGEPGPCPTGCMSEGAHNWDGYLPEKGTAHRYHQLFAAEDVVVDQEETYDEASGTSTMGELSISACVDRSLTVDQAEAVARALVEAARIVRSRATR